MVIVVSLMEEEGAARFGCCHKSRVNERPHCAVCSGSESCHRATAAGRERRVHYVVVIYKYTYVYKCCIGEPVMTEQEEQNKLIAPQAFLMCLANLNG